MTKSASLCLALAAAAAALCVRVGAARSVVGVSISAAHAPIRPPIHSGGRGGDSVAHAVSLARGRQALPTTTTTMATTNAAVAMKEAATAMEAALELRGGAQKTKTKRRSKGGGGGKRTGSIGGLSGSSTTKKKKKKTTATGNKAVGSSSAEKASAISDTMQKYKSILPLTRIYITTIGIVTLLGLVLGEELAQGLLALDPIRLVYGLELWRPFTAACFLGPPSIGWLMNAYYLFEYGSSLERAYGTAQHLIFLLWQIGLLSALSVLFGQPFFAQPVITSMLHVLSRSVPKQKVRWLIFNVPYWSLPYGLMASDVLQAQSVMAALPHVMGILTGHFYYFHKFVWPKMGGEDWLEAPDFLSKALDPNARDASVSKKSVNAALKSRKKGKGRKLGGGGR